MPVPKELREAHGHVEKAPASLLEYGRTCDSMKKLRKLKKKQEAGL